jgi:hypothetical protein
MFLGLLESYYKSDHYLLTPLCPAYTHAPYTWEYVLVTHLHVYTRSVYAGKAGCDRIDQQFLTSPRIVQYAQN